MEVAVMAPRLAGVHIGHMALDKGDADTEQGVPDRDRSMRVAARIDDDCVDLFLTRLLDAVDDAAFVIGLEGQNLEAELGPTLFD